MRDSVGRGTASGAEGARAGFVVVAPLIRVLCGLVGNSDVRWDARRGKVVPVKTDRGAAAADFSGVAAAFDGVGGADVGCYRVWVEGVADQALGAVFEAEVLVV